MKKIGIISDKSQVNRPPDIIAILGLRQFKTVCPIQCCEGILPLINHLKQEGTDSTIALIVFVLPHRFKLIDQGLRRASWHENSIEIELVKGRTDMWRCVHNHAASDHGITGVLCMLKAQASILCPFASGKRRDAFADQRTNCCRSTLPGV